MAAAAALAPSGISGRASATVVLDRLVKTNNFTGAPEQLPLLALLAPTAPVALVADGLLLLHAARLNPAVNAAMLTTPALHFLLTLEAQRIGSEAGDQRFCQSMSLAVSSRVTARANCASR